MISGLTKRHDKNRKALIHESFSILEKFYELPTIEHIEEVSREFFTYIKKRHYFLVVAVFDMQDRLLIIRDFSKNHGWELLGGSVDNYPIWDYAAAAEFMSQKMINANLFDVQPIAFIKNKFKYKTNTVYHEGIALIGRIHDGVKVVSRWCQGCQGVRNLHATLPCIKQG